MPKNIDWSESKFFHITIKCKTKTKNKQNRWLWEAVCECGTALLVDPYYIKRGSIKSCGCKNKTKAKDWTGKSYNKLTLVKPAPRTYGNKIKWEALCECGNTTQTYPYDVVKGHVKTCGFCSRPSSAKNWSGIRKGMLEFISRYKKYKSGQVVWLAKCDCGNSIYTVPSKNAKSCGCIEKEKSKKHCSELGKKSRKYNKYESAARKVYQRYKDGGISFECFMQLSQKNCNYCNIEPNTIYNFEGVKFVYNGLDRVDSSKNHTTDNVVTCCFPCNAAKSNKTVDEFLKHISRIYEYQLNKKNNKS